MRLLVVEDNRSLTANLFEYFEARGHVLDAAPDGITGLHLAVSHPYDVVVLDWMLPRLDGPGLLRRLRNEHGSGVPVIMLTARDELPDKIVGFRAGADDYLTKPFALPELEVRLEALLARARGRSRRNVLEVHDLRLDLDTLEATRAGQQRPRAVARQPLELALQADLQVHDEAAIAHVPAVVRVEHRAAAGGDHLVRTLQQVGERGRFARAEAGFALAREDGGDAGAGPALDLSVGIDERQPEAPGEALSDRRFARAHRSDEHEVGGGLHDSMLSGWHGLNAAAPTLVSRRQARHVRRVRTCPSPKSSRSPLLPPPASRMR